MEINLDSIKEKEVLIANSVNKLELFKREAKQMRLKLKNDKTLYLKGSHDDFMLKPNDSVIGKILDFLRD
ncbi:hypothetical protein A2715_03440 [Candidatus Woesebacteria bacterium RIFCSPHIGHO2_01_FULL_39_32]|uniref:Uncharacterized protein n=1 Tax=Candidatus Woesebacteria bacterium RIFCSPLOWO2_01_FULL_39_25 TaxID=1802521 RepID=A0A1F8BLR9_9BACT|nr:MAG: hypothetical protein A2124_00455 [Candidatus Woesebacteria bacterium GWB1_37_5]OGM24793.1 MAG: hypothetical protein A2715_03440 [Candidatus Woesebacteria bacterium RIFCSPHIGHO2_01_FULL_39_32]OGM37114.1 MAG: hypothetical protein A3F01_05380 [Candidatus Woesebacteria bacterium RIFCSPHIGHO2_12_FULL_38_11]OGM64619.1 MAG: hypothetical protein A2893_06355 [Candidatus Woesebacteria bacterium RIFCSPLOWO2_01_FULL_39_25]